MVYSWWGGGYHLWYQIPYIYSSINVNKMREIHVIISHGNGVLQNNSYRVSNCCKKVCQQGFQILLLNSKEKKMHLQSFSLI